MLKSCALLHVNQIDLFLFAALRLIIMKGILNAYFDANAETITYKADHNIGKRNNHNRLRNNMTSLLSKYTKTASDQIINTSCTISHNFCNQINDFSSRSIFLLPNSPLTCFVS